MPDDKNKETITPGDVAPIESVMGTGALVPYEGGELVLASPGALDNFVALAPGIDFFTLEQLDITHGATVWEWPGRAGMESRPSIDCVIAAAFLNQRKWWKVTVDDADGATGPPDCQSVDGINGYGSNVVDPEDREFGERKCSSCPWNEMGSARGGGPGTDCRPFAWLLFFEVGCYAPMRLQVPFMSLKGLRAFVMRGARYNRPVHSTVARMTLSKAGSGTKIYSVVNFEPVGDLPPEAAEEIKKLQPVLTTLHGQVLRRPAPAPEGLA